MNKLVGVGKKENYHIVEFQLINVDGIELKSHLLRPGVVVHAYNPSYSKGRNWPIQAKS
jgi:hypothetical protein